MTTRRMSAILFALMLVAVACSTDGGGDSGYGEEIREAYLQACETERSPEFCACTLDEIESKILEEDFIRFAIEATEEPPEEYIEVALACLSAADLGE